MPHQLILIYTDSVLQHNVDEAHLSNQTLAVQINKESFANCCLKEELKATKGELASIKYDQEQLLLSESSAKEAVNFYRNKHQSAVARDCRLESLDRFQAAASLMSELFSKDIPAEIIHGLMVALLLQRFKKKKSNSYQPKRCT